MAQESEDMTRTLIAKYAGNCQMCGEPWVAGQAIYFNPGWAGFYDTELCARSALTRVPVPIEGAKTSFTSSVCPPPPVVASTAVSGPLDARQEEIRNAHAENMRANEHLCTSIDCLSSTLADLRVAVQEWVKAVNK